jgi:hypothetical protein
VLLLLEMFFTRFDRHPRVLSLSLNTTKKEEEKIGTRRDKIFAKRKKNLVSTDLFFNFLWVFCRPVRRLGQRIRQRRNVFHSGHCGSRDLNCGHFILRPVKRKEEPLLILYFMLLLLLRISQVLNLCVCVCVCVLHVFMYVSLYTMLLEVVVVIMALSSRPEVNLLRVRKSL